MSIFKYTAKDQTGKAVRGKIEAKDKALVLERLKSQNLIIISIKEERQASAVSWTKTRKVKEDELVAFSRQLAAMVDSGISLIHALDILTEQMSKSPLSSVVRQMKEDIEAGQSMGYSMEKHPDVFSGIFINMVKAGESSGTLDEILDRLAGYLEKTAALKRKVKASMTYPIIVSIMALGITMVLILKVIPTFKGIFETFEGSLPLPTQVLIFISDTARAYFLYLVGIIGALVFGIKHYVRTEKGALMKDRVLLKMPVFGMLLRKVAITRFARTLATLIKSGVPILASLEIVGKTAGNKVVEFAVNDIRESIREGESIAKPLGASGVFPPMVVRMIAVGEQTGELEKMLNKIADFYDDQVDAAVSGLTSMIEPLIIAFLGLVVGGIVMAMFLPIFKLMEVVA